MAPRGGGHGGGGHSSGGSSSSTGGSGSSSGSSSSSSTPSRSPTNWSQHMILSGGDHFHNALQTAALVVMLFGLVSMLAVTAWSFTIKDHKRFSKRSFWLPL